MSTVRNHLASDHEREHTHWDGFAKGLTELGTHIRALHKEAGMKGESKAGDACDKLAGLAAGHAAYHAQQVEACRKAEDAGNLVKRANQVEELQVMVKAMVEESLNEVAPTLVSKVAPTAPRLVLRPGQPDPNAATKLVPPEFSKLVAVDEDYE